MQPLLLSIGKISLMGALTLFSVFSNATAKSTATTPRCPTGSTSLACPTKEHLIQHFQKKLLVEGKEWTIVGHALDLQSTNVSFGDTNIDGSLTGRLVCQYRGGLKLEITSLTFSASGCYLRCGADTHRPVAQTGASCNQVAFFCCKTKPRRLTLLLTGPQGFKALKISETLSGTSLQY